MLPQLNLTSSDFLSPDALQRAGGLVPLASSALQGGFAGVLRSTVQPAITLQAPSGGDLPPTGNALPLPAPLEELPLEADVELLIGEVDLGPLGLEPLSPAGDADVAAATFVAEIAPAAADEGLTTTIHVPPEPEIDTGATPLPPVATLSDGGDVAQPIPPVANAPPPATTADRGGRAEARDRGLDVATLQQRPAPVADGHAGIPARAPALSDEVLRPVSGRAAATDGEPQLLPERDSGNAASRRGAVAAESLQLPDDTPRAVRDDGIPQARTAQPAAWQLGTVPAELAPEPGQRIHAEFSAAMPRAAAAAPAQPVTTLPPAAQTIDIPVQQSGWDNLLADRVTMMANGKLQHAELRLTPAELGPLRIQLEIDDGVANVSFQSQHPLTREALEQAMPRLRELLAENGLSLGQADVRDDDSQQRSRETLADAPTTAGAGGDSGDVDETTTRVSRGAGNSLVDTFA